MQNKLDEFFQSIRKEPWTRDCPDDENFWKNLTTWVNERVLPDFLKHVTRQIDDIIDIDPDLSEPALLAISTRLMVEFLGASSASIRIYDPLTHQMLSYGSYPSMEKSRETYIPLENSISGEVVTTRETYLVPDILKEERYRDKGIVKELGVNSLMAVPLGIPRFFPHERDTAGVIQIYYPEKGRRFTPLEIQVAEVMARRLSFVIARKKIFALHKVNEKKEAIVRKIFLKLGSREGVKMKEVFNRIIPELADIIYIESCALFSVNDDNEHVTLDVGYPETEGYHGVGKIFAIRSEPAFELILKRGHYVHETPYEVVSQSYVLVVDPQASPLLSKNVKRFARNHNIHSILYIPLNLGEEITHFMTFDALNQRESYTEGEIEIFLFLGRELMKAQRMERLDDILHDFKNPAIATAGFARRLKRMLEEKGLHKGDEKIKKYVDILLEETSRMQEMALSLYHIGKEQVLNLTGVLMNRFEINKEAIVEQLKQNVTLSEGPFTEHLQVHCYPIHLERILDNLLNNATNAIPLQGGILAIRTYQEDEWACAEITNTGQISEEERLRLLEGEGQGRGIYITHRIIRLLKGKIDIRVGRDTTTIVVRLPLHRSTSDS